MHSWLCTQLDVGCAVSPGWTSPGNTCRRTWKVWNIRGKLEWSSKRAERLTVSLLCGFSRGPPCWLSARRTCRKTCTRTPSPRSVSSRGAFWNGPLRQIWDVKINRKIVANENCLIRTKIGNPTYLLEAVGNSLPQTEQNDLVDPSWFLRCCHMCRRPTKFPHTLQGIFWKKFRRYLCWRGKL